METFRHVLTRRTASNAPSFRTCDMGAGPYAGGPGLSNSGYQKQTACGADLRCAVWAASFACHTPANLRTALTRSGGEGFFTERGKSGLDPGTGTGLRRSHAMRF